MTFGFNLGNTQIIMSEDNTVGSREALSEKQKAILVGLMLGDGFLEHRYKYPRLRIDQSLKHKEYVDWLYDQFKDFCLQKPFRLDRVDKRNGKIYSHYIFTTVTSFSLVECRNIFYKKRKKIIPKNLRSLLKNELSLAVWYMDDGFKRSDCNSLYLCTSGFTINEQRFLQDILQKLYGFESKIHFAGKNTRIYFPVSSAKRFCDLIRPFVLPVFHYKLL